MCTDSQDDGSNHSVSVMSRDANPMRPLKTLIQFKELVSSHKKVFKAYAYATLWTCLLLREKKNQTYIALCEKVWH